MDGIKGENSAIATTAAAAAVHHHHHHLPTLHGHGREGSEGGSEEYYLSIGLNYSEAILYWGE